MEEFLASVCTVEWNERQDAGRTFADAQAELVPKHPDKTHLIEAFGKRFDEMIAGPIDGTVAILAELKRAGVPRYALTNWSAETFPPARARFEFLSWFDGIVVSGEEGVIKPDPRIFRILLERYRIARGACRVHRRQSRQRGGGAGSGHSRHPLPLCRALAPRARNARPHLKPTCDRSCDEFARRLRPGRWRRLTPCRKVAFRHRLPLRDPRRARSFRDHDLPLHRYRGQHATMGAGAGAHGNRAREA